MIFVTVGTHEQPFNRLVEYMDKWANIHNEEVIMQIGFSTYKPKKCNWRELFSYKEMQRLVDDARIVVTHGGPSSFLMPLQKGKIPIVVPRMKKYSEHVNNHQVDFCKKVFMTYENILLVEEINRLGDCLDDYNKITSNMNKKMYSNNELFCRKFEDIVRIIIK